MQWAPTLCDEGLHLLSKMLVYEPSRRITAKEALCHPYFRDIHMLLTRRMA